MASKKNSKQAADQNEAGLRFYKVWEMQKAIAAFQEAVTADPDNPDYHLNLARAYARSGDYEQAMEALGGYLQHETEEEVASRYEHLFSSAADQVEEILIAVMQKMEMPARQVGKALQMWLEYRISIGRRPLRMPKPELWAAAITYAVIKVNFADTKLVAVANAYDVNEGTLREKYGELKETLDLMPADYRYFTGEHNPLDKLVEAAQLLEELDRRFRED